MLVSDIPALRDFWYPVAYTGEVTDAPLAVRLFGADYVVWRPAPGAPASGARDRCRHRSAPLSQGWVEGSCLVCPYHGWRYDGLGTCTTIPSQDAATAIPVRARLDSVAVEERYGLVWVCAGTASEPVPVLAELDDGYTLIHELKQEWRASAPRMIDNALDVSHVPFVHRGTVGDPTRPRIGDFDVVRVGHRIAFSVTIGSRIAGVQAVNVGIDEGTVSRTTHAELLQPFVFKGVLEYDNGLRHVLYKTCTPIDDTTTLLFQFIGRNDHPSEDRWDAIAAVDRAVQAEDRRLLEGIDPDYPLDLTAELHTRADRMTVEYRRVLADLAARPAAFALEDAGV